MPRGISPVSEPKPPSVVEKLENASKFTRAAGSPRVPDVRTAPPRFAGLRNLKLSVADKPTYLAEKAERREKELEAAVLACSKPPSAQDRAKLQNLAKKAIAAHHDISKLAGIGFIDKTMHLERCIAIHQSVKWPVSHPHDAMGKISSELGTLYQDKLERNKGEHLTHFRWVEAMAMTHVFHHGTDSKFGLWKADTEHLNATIRRLPHPTPSSHFEDLTPAEISKLASGKSPWPHVPGIKSFVQDACRYVQSELAPAMVRNALPSKGENAVGDPQIFAALISGMAFPTPAEEHAAVSAPGAGDDVPLPPDDPAA